MLGMAGPRAPGPKFGEPILPDLRVRLICKNCKEDPPNLVEEYSAGDIVCGTCGTVLGDRIVDTRSEWRTFAGDEGGDDPSRVGAASNGLLAETYETVISGDDGGRGMSRDLQRAAARVAAQGNGATSVASLTAAFARISGQCEMMSLGRNVTERAQAVYKLVDEKGVVRSKKNAEVIGACILFATRDSGNDRSFQEIAKALRLRKKEVGQVFSIVKKTVLDERVMAGKDISGFASSEKSAEGLIGRLVNKLDAGVKVENAARHVAGIVAKKSGIAGRSPLTIAGAAVYFTCVLFGKSVPVKDIAELAAVSESTIKVIMKKIAMVLDEVVRPEWKEEYPEGYARLDAIRSSSASASAKPSRSATPSAAE